MKMDRDLGPLIAAYRGRPIRRRQLFTWVLPGVLAVLLPLGYGLWLGSQAYAHYGPVAAEHWSRPWYLLSALALALFLPYCLYRVLIARRFVAVHAEGLRLNLPAQGFLPLARPYTLIWAEIRGLSTDWVEEKFLGLSLETTQRALLHLQQGEPVRLDGRLQGVPELAAQIKARLYPRLLAQMRAALQAGESLVFGPLTVSSQWVHLYPPRSFRSHDRPHCAPRDPLPWGCIQRMEARSGRLAIVFSTSERAKLQKCTIPVAHIPNLELLVQLVHKGVDL